MTLLSFVRQDMTFLSHIRFQPKQIKEVFREKTQKFSLDDSSDKEFGKSMKETDNTALRMDLSNVDWHAYEDCFGTSEEKYLIHYIESIYPRLAENMMTYIFSEMKKI